MSRRALLAAVVALLTGGRPVAASVRCVTDPATGVVWHLPGGRA